MSYNKIVLSLVFVSLSGLVMCMDRGFTSLVKPSNSAKSFVETSPTSVVEVNEDFLHLPKCVQRGQLGISGLLTPAVVRHRNNSFIENNDLYGTPIAKEVKIRDVRFYGRRKQSQVLVVSQQSNDQVNTICALLSRCLGMK